MSNKKHMELKSKIKIGDKVYILKGKDNGKTGQVEKIYIADQKVVVREINKAKKHVKSKGKYQGGIFEIEKPLAIGNVQLVCPSCGKRTRVAYKIVGSDKQRICKKCHKIIERTKVEEKPKTK